MLSLERKYSKKRKAYFHPKRLTPPKQAGEAEAQNRRKT